MSNDVDTLGFAILGPGMVADYHAQAILANADQGARLIAVGHYDPPGFSQIMAKYGVPCLDQADTPRRRRRTDVFRQRGGLHPKPWIKVPSAP